MTKYAKFNSSTSITYAPQNYTTPDGSTICNFNTDPDVMLTYDFKPIEEAERDQIKFMMLPMKNMI